MEDLMELAVVLMKGKRTPTQRKHERADSAQYRFAVSSTQVQWCVLGLIWTIHALTKRAQAGVQRIPHRARAQAEQARCIPGLAGPSPRRHDGADGGGRGASLDAGGAPGTTGVRWHPILIGTRADPLSISPRGAAHDGGDYRNRVDFYNPECLSYA